MGRFLQIIAAVLVLVCLLTVFIAPSVDLPDSAVRGLQTWVLALFALSAMLLCGLLPSLLYFLRPHPATPLLVIDPDRSRSQRTC